MRMKVLLVLALALAISPMASADIILHFSTGVTMVGFYSAEPFDLTVTSNGTSNTTTTVNSGYTFGAVTAFSDTNVTQVDFSGTAGFYVLDDIQYMVGSTTYTLTFDEFNSDNVQVGSFYSGLAGGPSFNNLSQTLSQAYDANGNPVTDSGYNYGGYPPSSCNGKVGDTSAFGSPSSACTVLNEGTVITPPGVPEPGTLTLFGSGLIGIAGVLRRKLML